MGEEEFRTLGSHLIDRNVSFLNSLSQRPVTPAESPATVRKIVQAERFLPQEGEDPALLLDCASYLLLEHSLFNGHPRFRGYIRSSPAPIGASVICWPPPSIPKWERGCSRRWPAKSRRGPYAGSPKLLVVTPIAAVCLSAAETWPTSSASLRRARQRLLGCAKSGDERCATARLLL
jgi:hypothetical protein